MWTADCAIPNTAHDFRHRYAAGLYRETRDVLAVQRTLGHSSLSVTQVYLQSIGMEDATA